LLRLKRGSILPGSLSPNVSGDAAVFGSNSKIQARLYEPQHTPLSSLARTARRADSFLFLHYTLCTEMPSWVTDPQ